ncbi:MAG: FtsW/RodA/SpoVE family cell cycle protein [Clostridiales bacterium]|nr:FtsW/RodA/SpoVE family cell cycle protein [Clostridiales bacterium]
MIISERIRRILSVYDYALAALVLVLSGFGVLVIGSATGLGDGVMSSTFNAQIMWLVSGFVVMVTVSLIDFEVLCKLYIPLYVIMIGLLLLSEALQPPPPSTARWLFINLGSREFSIQPSEFAKIFMLIFLAKYIDKIGERINNILILLSVLAFGLLPIVMIFLEPALSASILQTIILLVLLFVGGVKYKYILIGLAVIVPLAAFMWFDLNREDPIIIDKILTYQLEDRIKPFFGIGEVDPNDLYQSEQSVKAIGSGQLVGKGLFKNTVTVPLAFNDFIFSIIGAEFGFAGCVLVILVILALVAKCFYVAWRAESFSGRLIASGVGAMIGAQAFVHIGVTTWLLPNTGIPLPFVSAGGSSMWINLAAIGMVINIGMKRTKNTLFTD